MPSKNELSAKEAKNATTTAASNTASVVTLNAPSVSLNATNYITGIILSASGAIAVAVAVTLTGIDGGTLTLQLPAATIAPVVILLGVHPLRVTPGSNAVLTLPALGSGIVGTATLFYQPGAA